MNAVRDKFPALIRAIAAMTISGPMGTRNAVACALLLSTACGGSPENYGAADQAFERSEKHPASRYLRRTQEPRPVDATQSHEPPEVVFGRIKDVATCVLGDELVLHGLRPGDYSILRFYDLRSGELLRTSDAIYRSGTEIVDLQIAEGFITCDPAEGAVYHAPRGLLGEVRRFERSGAESWIALVPDFKPIWYGVVEGGGAVVIPPSGAGFDRVEALGFLPHPGPIPLLRAVVGDRGHARLHQSGSLGFRCGRPG